MIIVVGDCAWLQDRLSDDEDLQWIGNVGNDAEDAQNWLHYLCDREQAVASGDKRVDNSVLLPRPDCPICMLTLNVAYNDSVYMPCCGKTLCRACFEERCLVKRLDYVKKQVTCTRKVNDAQSVLIDFSSYEEPSCPFCRAQTTKNWEEHTSLLVKRTESNDSDAMVHLYYAYLSGDGVEKDEHKAVDCLREAHKLGNMRAACVMAKFHLSGRLGFEKDVREAAVLASEAAKKGFPEGHGIMMKIYFKLGMTHCALFEARVAAAYGCERVLSNVRLGFQSGHVTKDEYARTLRAFQAAEQDMKSEARDRSRERRMREKFRQPNKT